MANRITTITVKFLNGRVRTYTARMSDSRRATHIIRLHRIPTIRSVACLVSK